MDAEGSPRADDRSHEHLLAESLVWTVWEDYSEDVYVDERSGSGGMVLVFPSVTLTRLS